MTVQRVGLQLLTVACCAAVLVAAAAVDRRDERVLQSEPLTSAWSPIVPAALTEAGASVAAQGKGKGKGFDVHNIDWRNKASRGSCCRICPNIFYAVPRVVPRPNPNLKPRFQSKKAAREARFAAVFDRREPPAFDSEDVSFVGFAEQLSVRPPADEQETRDGLRPDRFTPEKYPPWPLGEYTADPYQDQPIPEFTKAAELPGVQCCNVCASKGIGQMRYPDFLKWGENPATDDYPEPPWDIPCCKLCSKGCFPNGSRRPPESQAEQRGEHDDQSSFAETNAAAAAAANQTALLAATMRGGRKPKTYKARGNWPKTLDPPGANRPPVPPPDTQCNAMVGCCQVCYNHPFVYDHAPSGIW